MNFIKTFFLIMMVACNQTPSPKPTPTPTIEPTTSVTPVPTPIDTTRPSEFTIKPYKSSPDTTPFLRWNASLDANGVKYRLRVWEQFSDKLATYQIDIIGTSYQVKKLPPQYYMWHVTAQDPSGNGRISDTGKFQIYGTPVITKITVATDGKIRVHASLTLQVTGSPRLKVSGGYAKYISGDDTNILVFEAKKGKIEALELNGGRIATIHDADLILELPN